MFKNPYLSLRSILFLGPWMTMTCFGHGSVSEPISRILNVYNEGPDSPDSPFAVAAVAHAGGTQYYTWNQVSQNVPNYADSTFDTSYASVIPDGKLASGNNVGPAGLNFSGLDLVSNDWDWPATPMTAGPYVINWLATAPHDPSFFKVWITTHDYDPKTPLSWDKLEHLGNFDQNAYTKEGLNYRIPVTIPARTGRHVLYVAWQRIDPVGEVFFSASDIMFGETTVDPNDDPVVSVADASVNEGDGQVNLTISLDTPVPDGTSASIDYTTADGTALTPADYSASSGTLNFAAGEHSKTIQVAIVDNATPETSESFFVVLSSPLNLSAGDMSATVTIQDDDISAQGGYDFAARDDWGSGYNGWLLIGNATDSDITNGTVVITVAPGQTATPFGRPFTDNGDGTYTLTNISIPAQGEVQIDIGFSNASGGPRGPIQVSLNGGELGPLPPAVSIDDVTQPEGDGPGTVNLNVTLSKAASTAVHVSYQSLDGTATAPDDYTAASGNLEFLPGETTKTLTINFNGNPIDDGDRTFSVALAGVDGEEPPRFASLADQSATVTLINDDAAIGFTATGGSVFEGDSGSRDLVFRLILDRAVKSGETVSVDYMAHGHGADGGSDFSPTAGTYTFAEGSDSGTITVPILGDTIDERHEWFNLHFMSPVGLRLDSAEATGQIIDDEYDRSRLGNQRVVAYLDATSGSLNVPPADRVTHIMYAFADLNADGTLALGASVPTGLATLNALKSQNPDLKVLLSVGGWEWSDHFPGVAADPAKRTTFAQSCLQTVQDHGIDGIDLDWEWPGVPGGPGTTPTPQDGANFTLLVQELRTTLDTAGAAESPSRHYEITAFTAASPAGIAVLELDQLAPLFDFVNAQGYDLHGPWNGRTGHNAGLHPHPDDPLDARLNIHSILDQYLAGGFQRHQLLVGAPFYARTYHDVPNVDHGLYQPSSSTGTTPLYRDLTLQMQSLPRFWDPYAKVPYLYDATNGNWTSLDDPQAMHEKAIFSREGGFGGIYFWRNGGDTADRQLLTTLSDSLATVDHDADGLDDGWETAHFGDLTTTDGSIDSDQDRWLDSDEFLARTVPTDPADHLSLGIASIGETGPDLRFPSKPGVLYRLQTSLSMAEDSWENLGELIEGTGLEIELPAPISGPRDQARFYRLQVVTES